MPPPRIVFTKHANEMLRERQLQRAWIELTITGPGATEVDASRPNLVRAFRRIPQRRNLWLRVVYDRAWNNGGDRLLR